MDKFSHSSYSLRVYVLELGLLHSNHLACHINEPHQPFYVEQACDYLGERMASLFGITSAKYQYAIDEYHRIKKEKEEEKEENRLSEEAEQTFDQLQSQEGKDEPITSTKGQEGMSACPEVTYQVENENPAAPTTITVPVIVTAT
ncbi:hypothetical protein AMECASPLE_034451 [Ameca splendens]|uniref:Uncharacterized protein n=1 Tax=Ameca splendens TaxID=208324 RepID=A0ABV0Y736_9TELE